MFSSPPPLRSLQFYISLWSSGSVRGRASHVFSLLSTTFPLPQLEGNLVPSIFLFPAVSNAGHSPLSPSPLNLHVEDFTAVSIQPTFDFESYIIIYSSLSLIHGHMTLLSFPLIFLQFYFYFLPVAFNMLMTLANFNMNISHPRILDPINFQWLLLASYKVSYPRLCEDYWTRKASITSTFCSWVLQLNSMATHTHPLAPPSSCSGISTFEHWPSFGHPHHT